jgi:hypothetical protein
VPVSWTLDDTTGIVRIEYAMPYTFEEWRWVSEQLRNDPTVGFRRGIGFLTNRANLGTPPHWFSEAASRYAASFPAMLRGRKIAFVARSIGAYEVARWQSRIYEDAGAIATAFLSADAAELWLQERSDDPPRGRRDLPRFMNLC